MKSSPLNEACEGEGLRAIEAWDEERDGGGDSGRDMLCLRQICIATRADGLIIGVWSE